MDEPAIKCLISNSINGDKKSFRKLVETHQKFVYIIAFRLLCNSFDAEEVVQETFIRVWKNLSGFNIELKFSTWLYQIAVNLCYDKLRVSKKSKNRVVIDLKNSVILNHPSSEDIEASVINKELAEFIRLLTDHLTPKQKIVFVLSELEQLSANEISMITGLTPQKIKSNLYCAKQTIKEKLIRIEERRGRYEN